MSIYDDIEDDGFDVGVSLSKRDFKSEMLDYIDGMKKMLKKDKSINVVRGDGLTKNRMWSNVKEDGMVELCVRVSNKKVYFGRNNVGKVVRVKNDIESVEKGIKIIEKNIEKKSNEDFIKLNSDNEICFISKKGEVGSFVGGVFGVMKRGKLVLNIDIEDDNKDEFNKILEG